MADKSSSPTDAREQAVQIRTAWSNIGSDKLYGDMALAELESQIAALDEAARTITSLEDQILSARNEFWEKKRELWEQVKRARLGAKLKHGEDSDEYERFGGTRSSQRRRPVRVAARTESQA